MEVIETNKMVEHENLDVRNHYDWDQSAWIVCDSDLEKFNRKYTIRITDQWRKIWCQPEKRFEKEFGIPIVNKRISVTPIALVGGAACKTPEDFATIADTLDRGGQSSWCKLDRRIFCTGHPRE